MIKTRLVVTYPPEYDGELWVNVEEQKEATGTKSLHVDFIVRMLSGETATETLKRVGMDFQRIGR